MAEMRDPDGERPAEPSGGEVVDLQAYVDSRRGRARDGAEAGAHEAAARDRELVDAALEAEIADLQREQAVPADAADGRGQAALLRSAAARRLASEVRDRAAGMRDTAARTREQIVRERTARERAKSAVERRVTAEEVAAGGLDHVTGALQRRVGLAAIERELARTAGRDEPLVVIAVRVNGLRAINERCGLAAGDAVLRAVVAAIADVTRPRSVIARIAGAEFLCSLAGGTRATADHDLAEIRRRLLDGDHAPTVTVAVVERRRGDSVDALLDRATAALAAGGPG